MVCCVEMPHSVVLLYHLPLISTYCTYVLCVDPHFNCAIPKTFLHIPTFYLCVHMPVLRLTCSLGT